MVIDPIALIQTYTHRLAYTWISHSKIVCPVIIGMSVSLKLKISGNHILAAERIGGLVNLATTMAVADRKGRCCAGDPLRCPPHLPFTLDLVPRFASSTLILSYLIWDPFLKVFFFFLSFPI